MATDTPDFLRRLTGPFTDAVRALLTPLGFSLRLENALVTLSALVVVLALLGAILIACPPIGARLAARRRGSQWLLALVGVPAVLALLWLYRHPSTSIDALIVRWDHLVFAAAAGCALRAFPEVVRTWVIAVLGIGFLMHMTGWVPIGISLAYGLVGRAVVAIPGTRNPWVTAALQAGVLVAGLYACWMAHVGNYFVGLAAQGTLVFVILRHLSWVIDTRRGTSGSFGDYLFYLLFYPNCLGSVEMFRDFLERNRPLGSHFDYPLAARKFFVGGLQMFVAGQIPANMATLAAAANFQEAWFWSLAIFIRGALFLTGFWAVVDCIALLYGIRLRPNFYGLFTAENPSQFWYAWRGTMTRWLVQYVYIPLGGNRRAQVRNIYAAFAVSCVWHWSGVKFLHYGTGPRDYVPIFAWAFVNATGIATYVAVRRRGWHVLPMGTPAVVRRTLHRFGTMFFGSVTATFLGFHGELVPAFPGFVRHLLGL